MDLTSRTRIKCRFIAASRFAAPTVSAFCRTVPAFEGVTPDSVTTFGEGTIDGMVHLRWS